VKDHLYATVTSEALEEIQKQIKEAIAEGFHSGKVPKIKIELKKHLKPPIAKTD